MKRLLMLKSLMMVSLLSSVVNADSKLDKLLIKYEKHRIGYVLKRQGIKLNKVDIALKKDLAYKNWEGYTFNLNFTVKGKEINQKDFLFSDGTVIAPELINIKTKRSFKDKMYPTLTKNYFSKEHLIAGDPNAPHTMVIFSDPLCPICVDEVPGIMKRVMDNPKKIALYYYSMPLDMHPTAKTLSVASIIAKDMGIKDVDYKLYTLNEKYFYGEDKDKLYEPYVERDSQKALNYFNKQFKTDIKISDIKKSKYQEKIKYDLDMAEKAFVNGTPTIFFDGEIDKTRDKFTKYLK